MPSARGRAHASRAPSSEADPGRGRGGPSSGAEPARGERTPSNGMDPARGRRVPSSEAKPAQGDLQEGHLDGPLRSFAVWAIPCTVRQGMFCFVAGFKWGFPGC
jgi:hypothetical protein